MLRGIRRISIASARFSSSAHLGRLISVWIRLVVVEEVEAIVLDISNVPVIDHDLPAIKCQSTLQGLVRV
jgi:hypothetical protein